MKVGKIGLGKLGLEVAKAIAAKGHDVRGHDIVEKELPDSVEPSSISEIVSWADIIFASPQTPHQKKYEGDDRLPDSRADFNYKYLKRCVSDIAAEAEKQRRKITLAVISTCLPGTFEREIRKLLNPYVTYVYNPFFIAMGTVAEDFYNPEFVLLGSEESTHQVEKFYSTIHDKPIITTDITTAEGIKVSYNTWITAKTVIANIWGEIAVKTGMDFDALHKSWALATDRILSPRYMRAGMGDGGGCHPRDNIALSWLARKLRLSHDIFEDLMLAREDHEAYHAGLAMDAAKEHNLPLILLGKAFKPEVAIEDGSAAILMANILNEWDYPFQHFEDIDGPLPVAVYFIATNHKKYHSYHFPEGSYIISPHL